MSTLQTNTSFREVLFKIIPALWANRAQLHYRALRARLIASIMFIILSISFNLYIPWIFKGIVGHLSDPVSIGVTVVVSSVAFYGIATLLYKVIFIVQEMIFAKVAYQVARNLHAQTFTHLQNLSLRYHLEKKAGEIASVLSRINQSVSRFAFISLFYFSQLFVETCAASFILYLAYDWDYAGIVLGMVLVYGGVSCLIARKYAVAQEKTNTSDNKVGGKTLDALVNYQAVKNFNNQNFEQQSLDVALDHRAGCSTRRDIVMLWMWLWHGIITAVCVTAITIVSVYEVMGSSKTVSDFVLLNGYILQVSLPLTWLGFVLSDMMEAVNNLRQVFDIHKIKPEVIDKLHAKLLSVNNASICFDRVNFAYETRRPILKNVSFQVDPGQTVAIVGTTGAGKSTISQLLLRFYDIKGGRILIDGQNIADVSQDSVRQAIGVVPQDTTLFNESILYNIRYGRIDASDEEVIQAAKMAGIHDFIMSLPDQYQTTVGERGLKLSGGEKQRVAIARCLLKNPKILIFDEATSALDTETEKAIHANLWQISQGVTTMIIAHRLSTIVEADQIIVLEQGRIIEQGDHDALLAMGGKYAQLWQQQTNEEEDLASQLAIA